MNTIVAQVSLLLLGKSISVGAVHHLPEAFRLSAAVLVALRCGLHTPGLRRGPGGIPDRRRLVWEPHQ